MNIQTIERSSKLIINYIFFLFVADLIVQNARFQNDFTSQLMPSFRRDNLFIRSRLQQSHLHSKAVAWLTKKKIKLNHLSSWSIQILIKLKVFDTIRRHFLFKSSQKYFFPYLYKSFTAKFRRKKIQILFQNSKSFFFNYLNGEFRKSDYKSDLFQHTCPLMCIPSTHMLK